MDEKIPQDLLKFPPEALHPLRRVAAFLGRGRASVRKLVRDQVLPSVLEGHTYYVQTKDIKAYIDLRKTWKKGKR